MLDRTDEQPLSDAAAGFAKDQLKAFVERIERVEAEIKELNSDKRDIYAEAKGNGFCPKAIKEIVALRRKDADERAEHETIVELYMQALGMIG